MIFKPIKKNAKLLGALCACTIFSIATPANAAMVLTIDDPTTTGIDVTAFDTDNDGVIVYNAGVGSFFVTVTTGISKPAVTGLQLLHLNSVEVSGGAGNLQIKLTDTGYTGSPSALTGVFAASAAQNSIDFDFLYDTADAQFGGTSFFNPAAGTGAFSGTGTGPVSVSAPYSLTIVADVNHSGSGVSSFDAEIQAVPVPAAVWLFGTGLIGLVGVARRRV